jgi:hypothetical protein
MNFSVHGWRACDAISGLRVSLCCAPIEIAQAIGGIPM